MPWAALDDGFHEDPRILEAGLAAAGLYCSAMSYVSRHLLDGFIPRKALVRLLEDGDAEPLSALLRVGLMREDGERFELVDYFKGNQTREVVEKRRRDARARAQKAAEKSAQKRREKTHHANVDTDDEEPEAIPF